MYHILTLLVIILFLLGLKVKLVIGM